MVAGAAKAAAVLRPEGRIALFWNVMQFPPDLLAAFGGVYEQVLSSSGFASAFADSLATYSKGFVKVADGINQAGGFGAPEQWRFDWTKTYSTEQWIEQVPNLRRPQSDPARQARRTPQRYRRGGRCCRRQLHDGLCRGGGHGRTEPVSITNVSDETLGLPAAHGY